MVESTSQSTDNPKPCPKCGSIFEIWAQICTNCGFEWHNDFEKKKHLIIITSSTLAGIHLIMLVVSYLILPLIFMDIYYITGIPGVILVNLLGFKGIEGEFYPGPTFLALIMGYLIWCFIYWLFAKFLAWYNYSNTNSISPFN